MEIRPASPLIPTFRPEESEDLYDLDIEVTEALPGDKPVDCSSETCNCKTIACQTQTKGSCHSCGCTNSWGCNKIGC